MAGPSPFTVMTNSANSVKTFRENSDVSFEGQRVV